jgi:ABC-type multidrug transport system fused ATPase/permease subunit
MLGLSAWVVATGGGDLAIGGGLRLSIRTGARPFFVAGIAITLIALIAPAWRSRFDRIVSRLAATPRSAFIAMTLILAAGVLLIGLRYGSFVATAADSYGYVTQAELWQHGIPQIEQTPQMPLQSAPWPDARYTLAPLGYRPSFDGRATVPVYPPGYPLLMTAALSIVGQGAQYLVVPLLATVTVLVTFLLGRQVAGNWGGLTAAFLLCASPSFLFQTVIPMSDVPATAAWTLALLLVLRPTLTRAIMAGAFCGIAILIRPNLSPVVGLLVLMLRSRPRHMIAIIGALLTAVLALAWLNTRWYGEPFKSGYGDLNVLFALHNLPTNLRHYAHWLWETQTLAIFLAPLALWTTASRPERADRGRLFFFAAGVALCYAFYLPFDTWDYLRFLLPAYPALLILTSAVLIDLLARLPRPIGALVTVTLVGTIALSGVREAEAKGVFDNWRSLRRFVDIPAYARTHLPPNAIYLTRLYSGSLRYYADRPTLRWDVLDPAWLDQTIAYLHAQGFAPLLVIEDGDEDREFRQRFQASRLGSLAWTPIAEYRSIQDVRIFNPDDCCHATATVPDPIPVSH